MLVWVNDIIALWMIITTRITHIQIILPMIEWIIVVLIIFSSAPISSIGVLDNLNVQGRQIKSVLRQLIFCSMSSAVQCPAASVGHPCMQHRSMSSGSMSSESMSNESMSNESVSIGCRWTYLHAACIDVHGMYVQRNNVQRNTGITLTYLYDAIIY